MFEFDSDIEEELLDTIIAQNEMQGQKNPNVTSKEVLLNNSINVNVDKNNSVNLNRSKVVSNQAQISRRNGASVTIERRFPGPAGILPEKRNARLPLTTDPSILTNSQTLNILKTKPLHNVQKWQNFLESLAWRKILNDLETEAFGKEILKNINIKNIKEKASARLLVDKKVPFLVVILNEIDLSCSDPSITLCDQTGIMNGTLHRDTWKQFEDELFPGCVLILRNVGVLSLATNSHKNQHYLNITSSNLAALYCDQEDAVRIIDISPFDSDELVFANNSWISNTTPVTSTMPSLTDMDQSLFSSPLTTRNNTSSNNSLCLNRRVPMQSTPVTPRNNAMRETITNQRISQGNFRQPLFSPIVRKPNSSNVYESANNSDSVRDASTILGLLSNNNESTSSCNSFTKTANTSFRMNNKSVSGNHYESVDVCVSGKSGSSSGDRNVLSRKLVVNKNNVPETQSNSFALDINSKNSININCDKSFENSGGVRRQNDNRFSFNFSPKVARIESPKSNCVVSSIDQNNSKEVDTQSNCGNFVPYENSGDEQWEVNSILSSIDTSSFFEEDF